MWIKDSYVNFDNDIVAHLTFFILWNYCLKISAENAQILLIHVQMGKIGLESLYTTQY